MSVKLPGLWLVIGCGSLVGSRFAELIEPQKGFYCAGGSMDQSGVHPIGFHELNITDIKRLDEVIRDFPGKYIINFAAITAVDEMEKTRPTDPNDPVQLTENLAYQVNVVGTRNLLAACEKYNKFPIFISTGFVYDGESGPYSDEEGVADDINKVGWYAWTKILAEKEVEKSGIPSLTLRIDYPYRTSYEGKGDFARNFLKLYDEGKFYPIFTDQTLSPTLIDDLPEAVSVLLDNHQTGVFNITSPEIVTPYDFCCELLRVARGVAEPETIVPKGTLAEFQASHPKMSKRGINGGILPNKISQLGFTPTSWKEGIRKAFGK